MCVQDLFESFATSMVNAVTSESNKPRPLSSAHQVNSVIIIMRPTLSRLHYALPPSVRLSVRLPRANRSLENGTSYNVHTFRGSYSRTYSHLKVALPNWQSYFEMTIKIKVARNKIVKIVFGAYIREKNASLHVKSRPRLPTSIPCCTFRQVQCSSETAQFSR